MGCLNSLKWLTRLSMQLPGTLRLRTETISCHVVTMDFKGSFIILFLNYCVLTKPVSLPWDGYILGTNWLLMVLPEDRGRCLDFSIYIKLWFILMNSLESECSPWKDWDPGICQTDTEQGEMDGWKRWARIASGVPVTQSFSSRPHLLFLHQSIPRISVMDCHQIGGDIRTTKFLHSFIIPATLVELGSGLFPCYRWSFLRMSSRGDHPRTMSSEKVRELPLAHRSHSTRLPRGPQSS